MLEILVEMNYTPCWSISEKWKREVIAKQTNHWGRSSYANGILELDFQMVGCGHASSYTTLRKPKSSGQHIYGLTSIISIYSKKRNKGTHRNVQILRTKGQLGRGNWIGRIPTSFEEPLEKQQRSHVNVRADDVTLTENETFVLQTSGSSLKGSWKSATRAESSIEFKTSVEGYFNKCLSLSFRLLRSVSLT